MTAQRRVPSPAGLVDYADIRDDWYKGGDLMARLMARAAAGEALRFYGFPRQWIPLFSLFRASWSASIAPPTDIPFASDLSAEAIVDLFEAAAARGQARSFVEAWVATDALLSDVLHRLDRHEVNLANPSNGLPLTGWQSYGRPEVQAFDQLVLASAQASREVAVILPCARGRPYHVSRTHRRIWRRLEEAGIHARDTDAVVMSSIGVVPSGLWDHPIALSYDSGVPDIWRVLRLARAFFKKANYRQAVDCLEFAPYSEILGILAREGVIGEILPGPERRIRRLPRP